MQSLSTKVQPILKVSVRTGYATTVPFNEHYKYESHKNKVTRLYKKALRSVHDWSLGCGNALETSIWERTMVRARFDKHKNEPDMIKAAALLKAGEEEWWLNRHYSPIVFPWSDGGVAYQRATKNQKYSQNMQWWNPEDRARMPDMYAKYEKLQLLRQESWEEEMARLDEHEEELAEMGETITDQLPAAKKVDGLPPFWWNFATRGHERPECNDWDWQTRDLGV